MSTTSPMTEGTVTRVLLALWRLSGRSGGETTLQQVLRETLAPLPDVQEALGILRQRGCLIEATPTSLSLVSTGLACWRDVLEGAAKEKKLRLGRRVMVYVKTTSTNDVAWQCASSGDADGLVVVADEQTAGRGRRGHQWAAKAGQSVLMSVLLRDLREDGVNGDTLTLLAGLATAKGLESLLGGERLQIKWPNDILHEGRKLAGILVERRGGGNGQAVVGVGVNVNQAASDFPPELSKQAASLLQVNGGGRGAGIDRARVMAAILEQLDSYLGETPAEWLGEWKSRCPLLNQRVRVRAGETLMSGQILDIDPLRGLLLRDDGGATHFLSAQATTLSV